MDFEQVQAAAEKRARSVVEMTAQEHLVRAAELLAGTYERDNAPWSPYNYSLAAPTSYEIALASAHAAVAAAKAVVGRAAQVSVAMPEIRPAVPPDTADDQARNQPAASTRS